MKKYIAFLRGINVGGKNVIKMADLKKTLESIGLHRIKTLLASGNIYFETNDEKLLQKIPEELQRDFSYKKEIIFRTKEQIDNLVASNPFKDIAITPETRLYVTLLLEKPSIKPSRQENFEILTSTETEVCSVLTITDQFKTSEAMKILEKEYGRRVTTRNWKTIQKLAEL